MKISFFLLFVISQFVLFSGCRNEAKRKVNTLNKPKNNTKAIVETSPNTKNDSSTTLLSKIPDAIDLKIAQIEKDIKAKKLIYQEENQMDFIGGAVSGYFDKNGQIKKLYSAYAGESDASIINTYFEGEKIISIHFSFVNFIRGPDDSKNRNLEIAFKKIRFQNGKVISDEQKLLVKNHWFKEKSIPKTDTLISDVYQMIANLKQNHD